MACARARSAAQTATRRDVSPAWAKAGSTARAMSPRPTTAYQICFAMLSLSSRNSLGWVSSGQKCKGEATEFRYVPPEREGTEEGCHSQDLGPEGETHPYISLLPVTKHVTSVRHAA